MVSLGRSMVLASRVVLEHTLGRPIREGLCALHRCDNKSCVNADHLYEGSRQDNWNDVGDRQGNPLIRQAARLKRRATLIRRRGHAASRARLNPEAVRVIRFLLSRGVSQKRIAAACGIDKSAISNIHTRKAWAEPSDWVRSVAA